MQAGLSERAAPAGAGGRWQPGPREPRLERGGLHVWRAELRSLPVGLGSLLQDAERERAQRILAPARRERWSLARGLLRILLGAYLDLDAHAVRLTTGPHGKPALARDRRRTAAAPGGRAGAPGLWFNLSHSAGTALYAFSAEGPVGVDVELARRELDAVALAARAFGPAQARRLAALDPASAQRELRRAWVRHEAVLKCRGLGLGARQAGDQGDDAAQPWIAELDLGAGQAGAVAAMNRPTTLSCWGWPPAREGTRETRRRRS